MSELILGDGNNSDDETVIIGDGNEETNSGLLEDVTDYFQNNVFVDPIPSTSTGRGRGKVGHIIVLVIIYSNISAKKSNKDISKILPTHSAFQKHITSHTSAPILIYNIFF